MKIHLRLTRLMRSDDVFLLSNSLICGKQSDNFFQVKNSCSTRGPRGKSDTISPLLSVLNSSLYLYLGWVVQAEKHHNTWVKGPKFWPGAAQSAAPRFSGQVNSEEMTNLT